MNGENTATVRTGVNVFVIGVIVFAVQKITGETLDPSNPWILLVAPAIVTFGYRLSRWLSSRFPSLAWVLFGIGTPPSY